MLDPKRKRLKSLSAVVRGALLRGCQALAERSRRLDSKAVRVITHYGEPYLNRYRLHVAKPKWVRAYLHGFVRPDADDEEHHSHPWPLALAVVLSGGYYEARLAQDLSVTTRWLGPWSVNILRRSTYHRVVSLAEDEPVFTIMVVFGRNADDWTFKHPKTGKVTPWRVFVERQGRRAA